MAVLIWSLFPPRVFNSFTQTKIVMNTATMKKAAFKTGDVLEYLGARIAHTIIEGKEVPTIFPGMRCTITRTDPPRKGYGYIKDDEDGEPMVDRGTDGHNVYTNAAGQGRIIWPDDADQWKLVKPAN